MNKQILTGIAFAGMMGFASAQQLPLYSQYHAIPFLLNPSMAGTSDFMNAALIHKSMWTDIKGAPITSAFTIDGPIQEKNIGLGGVIFSDVTDITQRIGFSTSYSYRLQINDNSRLMLGTALGLMDNKIDFGRAVVKDENDPLILQNSQHKTIFNVDFGTTFIWKALEIGIAVPQLLGNQIKLSNDVNNAYYSLSRHYLFSVKYGFALNKTKSLKLYPLALVRYAKNTPLQYDINAVLDLENKGWFAVTYRSNYAVGLNLGVHITKSLRAGYAYDLAIGKIASYSGGSHEIMLGYTFGKRGDGNSSSSDNSKTDARQDALTDSMMTVLKKENEVNKKQIDDLQKQLEDVKTKQNSQGTNNGGDNKTPNQDGNKTKSDSTTGSLRTGNASDFVDEDGKQLIPNYYVVVGSFKNKEGAMERKNDYLKRGFPMSSYMYNDKNKMYYTAVISTANEEAANRELADAKYGTPDAWVFVLK